jgi:hypothetical protein
VQNAGLLFVSLKAADPVADDRSYMAIKANIDTAALEGIDVLEVTLNSLEIELNQAASPTDPGLEALDWTTSVNLNPTQWTEDGAIAAADYDLLAATNGDGEAPAETDTQIDLDEGVFRLFADAEIVVADFIYVAGQIAVEKRDSVPVREIGATESFNASVLSLGIADAAVFAGVGGELFDPDAYDPLDPAAEDSGATGVVLTIDALGLVIVKENPVPLAEGETPPVTPPFLKSYFAMKASGSAALVGLDNIVLGGTLNVAIN